MNSKEHAARRLDKVIDRYGEKIGYETLELMLQERAQDMHEIAIDEGEIESINAEDIGLKE